MDACEHEPKEGCGCDPCLAALDELHTLATDATDRWREALDRDPIAYFTPVLAAHPARVSEDRPLTPRAAS